MSALMAAPPVVSRPAAAARLEVDLAAIAANTRTVAARTSSALMAVVKADGFGHGAVDVARTALTNGATWLGVTSVEEALALRSAELDAPVLSWLNAPDADFESAVRAGVDLAVPHQTHLSAVIDAAGRTGIPARVHLHLDAGMARDGAAPAQWPALCRAARRGERAGVLRVVGVMGHLGCADDPTDPCNRLGRHRFVRGVTAARRAGLAPEHRHLAATAATLTDPRTHHTLVRVGAGLVGIDPSGSTNLRTAMRLRAPVVTTRDVLAGTPVGYSHTWSAPQATRLALLPVGYADGLPRTVAGGAEVLLRGRRCPVVGRVSMDQVVVDVGSAPVLPGEVATLLGPGDDGEPTLQEWAAWAGTIEHEIVTGFGAAPRLHRTVRAAGPRAVVA